MADIESISHSGMVAPDTLAVHQFYVDVLGGTCARSEERRVGKECRL